MTGPSTQLWSFESPTFRWGYSMTSPPFVISGELTAQFFPMFHVFPPSSAVLCATREARSVTSRGRRRRCRGRARDADIVFVAVSGIVIGDAPQEKVTTPPPERAVSNEKARHQEEEERRTSQKRLPSGLVAQNRIRAGRRRLRPPSSL